jgi:hypothetical protein
MVFPTPSFNLSISTSQSDQDTPNSSQKVRSPAILSSLFASQPKLQNYPQYSDFLKAECLKIIKYSCKLWTTTELSLSKKVNDQGSLL